MQGLECLAGSTIEFLLVIALGSVAGDSTTPRDALRPGDIGMPVALDQRQSRPTAP